MSLFNKLSRPDRTQTQLAYKVKYWPWRELTSSAHGLIRNNRIVYLRKSQIVGSLDDSQAGVVYQGCRYVIVWAYNNVPTEEEWNKRADISLITCEFRVSPATGCGPVVILSFGLPSERFHAHAKGEMYE